MVKVLGQEEPIAGVVSWRLLIPLVITGAAVGLLTLLGVFILNQYVVGQIACQVGSSLITCSAAPLFSSGIALVVTTIAGLIFMVRRRVYRPLLVAIGALISLWGIGASWPEQLTLPSGLLIVIASALVYALLGWFALIRNFIISLAVIVMSVVVVRILIML